MKNFGFREPLLFAASALAAAVVMHPVESKAGWRTQHSSACNVINQQQDAQYWNGNANEKMVAFLPGGGWDPMSSRLRLYCPVSDDSDFSKQNATAGLTLYHVNGSMSTQWNACLSYEHAAGGACSNTRFVETNGAVTTTIAVSESPWTTRAHYAYLFVGLASRVSANDQPNRLQGYYFQH